MEFKRIEVKMYKIDFMCPKCKDGVMEFTGSIGSINGIPCYEHKCNICNNIMNIEKKFPKFEYEELT